MTERQDITEEPTEQEPADEAPVPLESDPADWQEQHQDVPGDPDERR